MLFVKKLSDNAVLPTRGSDIAAGLDLYSAEYTVIPSKDKALVKTDIALSIPEGCYGRIAPRSGLAAKHFIDVGAGVIDRDYTGNLGIVLFNFANKDFEVKRGDRIAQLILEKNLICDVKLVDELPSTNRGDGGFGSTGV